MVEEAFLEKRSHLKLVRPLGEAKVVCVADISYSGIGMGEAKLRHSSTISHLAL